MILYHLASDDDKENEVSSAHLLLPRGLVMYACGPALDELDPVYDQDPLHDPTANTAKFKKTQHHFLWRGSIEHHSPHGVLMFGPLCFAFHPTFLFYQKEARYQGIDQNIRINRTGITLCTFSSFQMKNIP